MQSVNLKAQDLRRVVLEKLRVNLDVDVPPHILMNADIYERTDYLSDQIIYTLSTYLTCRKTATETKTERVVAAVKVPQTWWDHVLEHFAPEWFLLRWPAKYRTIDVRLEEIHQNTTTNICPHIAVPPGVGTHFEFLTR